MFKTRHACFILFIVLALVTLGIDQATKYTYRPQFLFQVSGSDAQSLLKDLSSDHWVLPRSLHQSFKAQNLSLDDRASIRANLERHTRQMTIAEPAREWQITNHHPQYLLVETAEKAVDVYQIRWQVGETQEVLPILNFTYVRNTGSLWGMFSGNAFRLGLVSLTVSLGIIWYAARRKTFEENGVLMYITLGFLLGGAIGNMWDRLYLGFVVDFFDLRWNGQNIWAIFNVADIAIDVAIGLFILLAFVDHKHKKPLSEKAELNPVDAAVKFPTAPLPESERSEEMN